jgi:hypothetical protein
MSEKLDVLKRREERHKKKALEHERKAKAAEKARAEIEENADTRRKILDGAHIQTEALKNPEIAALLHRLRDEKLISDIDRALFGLAPLGEEERDRRAAKRYAARKRKGATLEPEVARKANEMEAA